MEVAELEVRLEKDGITPLLKSVLDTFEKLEDWDKFNVFDVEAATEGNAFLFVGYTLLHKLGVARELKLDDKKLRALLRALQAGLHPTPFQSSTHAAEDAHAMNFILTTGGLIEKLKLTKLDIFAAIFAELMHNYDHPGFNNSYHVVTKSLLAIRYSDCSVLENNSLACVFEMVQQPRYNLFSDWSEDQFRDFRDTVTEMVFATDMGKHAGYMQKFQERLRVGSRDPFPYRKADVRLGLCMAIKVANMSNTCKPLPLALKWVELICEAFFNQGDWERKLGMPCQPFMDRTATAIPKGQIAFTNYIIVPMYTAFVEFLPAMAFTLENNMKVKAHWQEQAKFDESTNGAP